MGASVSVIIPAYNPGPYLREAIGSVIAQSFTDWELIVVDDGSTEDLSYVDAMDPRIRRLRQVNKKLPAARNAGILASQAALIGFLDADDVWEPGKLAAQVAYMNSHSDVAMCHTGFQIIEENGVIVGPGFGRPVDGYLELLGNANAVCVSSAIVRRTSLAVAGLFDPFKHAVEDYDLWLKLSRHYRLGFVEGNHARYRVHSQNMSGNPRLMAYEVGVLMDRHRELARQQRDRKAAKIAAWSRRQARIGWGCKAYDRCRSSFRQRNWRQFLTELNTAVRLAPWYTFRTSLKWPLAHLMTMRGGGA